MGPRAAAAGFAVNETPAVGSVAWSNAGTYGHVAYVVAVNGSNVTIEEYNHHYTGHYNKREVSAASFTGYIHFADTPAQPDPTPVHGARRARNVDRAGNAEPPGQHVQEPAQRVRSRPGNPRRRICAGFLQAL